MKKIDFYNALHVIGPIMILLTILVTYNIIYTDEEEPFTLEGEIETITGTNPELGPVFSTITLKTGERLFVLGTPNIEVDMSYIFTVGKMENGYKLLSFTGAI